VVHEKVPAEDFHITKKIVLVCRDGSYFSEFFFIWANAHGKAGAFPQQLRVPTAASQNAGFRKALAHQPAERRSEHS
jgi:hypothetical protein